MVLTTTFRVVGGQARVIDFFALPADGPGGDPPQIIRIVEGERGSVRFDATIAPRFDSGAVDAWIRRHGIGEFTAIGGDDGLVVVSDAPLEESGHRLESSFAVRAGDRVHFSVIYGNPAELEPEALHPPAPADLDEALEETLRFWRQWAARLSVEGGDSAEVIRSALVRKALTYAGTGALVAAPTTSLPEAPRAERNWDYRYSWIRDSSMAVRSLVHLGCEPEADAFRRFVERSAAGNAADLQILYGAGGERRLRESNLDLEGCWAVLDKGLKPANACMRKAPSAGSGNEISGAVGERGL